MGSLHPSISHGFLPQHRLWSNRGSVFMCDARGLNPFDPGPLGGMEEEFTICRRLESVSSGRKFRGGFHKTEKQVIVAFHKKIGSPYIETDLDTVRVDHGAKAGHEGCLAVEIGPTVLKTPQEMGIAIKLEDEFFSVDDEGAIGFWERRSPFVSVVFIAGPFEPPDEHGFAR